MRTTDLDLEYVETEKVDFKMFDFLFSGSVEQTNLVRMRNSNLGQSAPSLTVNNGNNGSNGSNGSNSNSVGQFFSSNNTFFKLFNREQSQLPKYEHVFFFRPRIFVFVSFAFLLIKTFFQSQNYFSISIILDGKHL